MIKRILKIALCFVTVTGITLIIYTAAANPPYRILFNCVAAAGLGLPSPETISADNTLSSDIDLVGIAAGYGTPAAIGYYDSLPVLPPLAGQDPPQPPEESPPLPENAFPIIPLDMSEEQTANGIRLKNESKYTPDPNILAKKEYPLPYTQAASPNPGNQPLVLIVHTHGTECYSPEGTNFYTPDTPTRTTDTTQNVVAVGSVLAEVLTERGISTIHCTTMFDEKSYSESYDLSETVIKDYLQKYPSIQYVFDLHRDSITRENNEKIKPYTVVNGIPTAQAMFVVGTDSAGAPHPNWEQNLTVASILQSNMLARYGNVMRPINLRAASFNAEHAPGSILIEIGSCGNSLSEAQNCARLLGDVIAETILSDGANS